MRLDPRRRDPCRGRVPRQGRHLRLEPIRRQETRELGFLFVSALAIHATACANEAAPPGMMPDSRPPVVAEIKPAPDTVIPGFDDRVEIRFDEPVNVGRTLNQQLIASPAGRYEVQVGFSTVRIRPRDPWRVAVYCFEIPAGISDLANNRTETEEEYCFSTGPPITSTLVTGTVTDGTTGRPVARGRVLFLALPQDSTPYTAVMDQDGQFRLRSVPPADYWAYAFVDQNNNFALDHTLEPHDSVAFSLSGETSTETLSLSILEPDSTPPVLFLAEAVDSMTVRLGFDDFVQFVQENASVTVTDSATGVAVDVASVHIAEPETVLAALAALAAEDSVAGADVDPEAAADSIAGADVDPEAAADSIADADVAPAAGDSMAAAAEPVPVEAEADLRPADPLAPPQGPPGAPPVAGPGQEPRADLPSQTVTVILAEPLVEGTYRVEARQFVNVRKLSGGGDTTFAYTPEPAAEEAAQDTTGAVQDSTGAAQDTAGAAQDTAGAVQDTAGAVQDTAGTVQDTAGVVPDSTARDTARNSGLRAVARPRRRAPA